MESSREGCQDLFNFDFKFAGAKFPNDRFDCGASALRGRVHNAIEKIESNSSLSLSHFGDNRSGRISTKYLVKQFRFTPVSIWETGIF